MILILRKKALLISLALLPIIFIICLCFGTIFISPLNLFKEYNIYKPIITLRFLRLLTAFIVGGGLACAGVGCQAVLRNALAEPFILGVSGGASIGTAIAIISGLAAISYFVLPLFAFIGAVITLMVVLLLARRSGVEYSTNIMLSGVIAGTFCSSVLMFIISTLGADKLNSITWWMLGNLQPGNSELLYLVITIVLAGVFVLFLYGREANAISMGEEMAYYLGNSPRKISLIILGISSLITASVVTISGIIGFVGLIVPHILRQAVGADHRKLFPLALLTGGMFLMICDTIAKTILSPQEIPVGVITAFIGGPFFLWVLNRRHN